jgi:hypothetical protein
MLLSLLPSVDVIEFHTTEAYSNWDPTTVKYSTQTLQGIIQFNLYLFMCKFNITIANYKVRIKLE